MRRLSIFLLLLCCGWSVQARDQVTQQMLESGAFALKDIVQDENGFLRNRSGDGFLTVSQLNRPRDQACALELDLEFAEPLLRPAQFEIFWRTRQMGYSERNKGFFIINQESSKSRNRYLLPLCKMFHYSGNLNNGARQAPIDGLRIDYPVNKTVAIKFHAVAFRDAATTLDMLAEPPADLHILEAYERIEPKSFTSLDVALPKLFFAFEEGLHRLTIDKAFLAFWLLLMGLLVVIILRSWIQQNSRP